MGKERKPLPIAPTTIIEGTVEQPKPEPQVVTAPPKPVLNIPVPPAEINEVAAKEQKKAGFAKVKTKDGKDDVDEATSYMRNGYWIDEKINDVFIPLQERKKVFKLLYPNGSMGAKIIQAGFKFATAEAAIFRDTSDANPFASESGAANVNDLPNALRKKVPQCAASNAMWRTLSLGGIPMTLSEIFTLLDTKKLSEEQILQTLDFDNEILSDKWNEQKEFRAEAERTKQRIEQQKASGWQDADELLDELDKQSSKIQLGDAYVTEEELIDALRIEIVANDNKSLISRLLTLLKEITSLNKKPTEIIENQTENQENEVKTAKTEVKTPKTETKQKKPAKKRKGKQSRKFIARDIKTGHIVKTFSNRADAALWAKVSPNSISAVLSPSTKNRTAGGYIWTKDVA